MPSRWARKVPQEDEEEEEKEGAGRKKKIERNKEFLKAHEWLACRLQFSSPLGRELLG